MAKWHKQKETWTAYKYEKMFNLQIKIWDTISCPRTEKNSSNAKDGGMGPP